MIMRCKCCNQELLKGEYDRFQGDGQHYEREDMCKVCVSSSRSLYTVWDYEYTHGSSEEGITPPKEDSC